MLGKLEIGKLYKLKPKHHWWWGLRSYLDSTNPKLIPKIPMIEIQEKTWTHPGSISIEDDVLFLLKHSKRLKLVILGENKQMPAFLFMTKNGKLCYLHDSIDPIKQFKKNWMQL